MFGDTLMRIDEIQSILALCQLDFNQLEKLAYARRSVQDDEHWVLEFLTTEGQGAVTHTLPSAQAERFWNVVGALLTEQVVPSMLSFGRDAYVQLAYLERCQLVLYHERYVVLLHFSGGGVVQVWTDGRARGEHILNSLKELMNQEHPPQNTSLH
jgi:hypothetical protein